jgi:hypothetical protein
MNQANTVTTRTSTMRTPLLTFLLTVRVTIQSGNEVNDAGPNLFVQKSQLTGSIIVA